ncbi:hypothetical protein JVU11DRAFT_2089 [Chiua virens]|nr:hypothetical protein JVU11DRAFT_2089 [Chiua virens]
MSSVVATLQARAFHHAFDIPEDVWNALSQKEAAANVILPFAKKALGFPRGGKDQLWIALYDDDTKSVEFVLSCTKGSLGNYPIFIVSCKSPAQLAQEEQRGKRIADSLLPLVLCLLDEVPPQRVFSVFSIAKVTETFAEIFQAHVPQHHGIRAHKIAYYDTTFTFCTGETLKKESPSVMSTLPGSEDVSIALRRADMSDLKEIQVLCKAFSETSPPFVLDDAGAELEANLLITNQQVWVHMMQTADQVPEIACLIATTRESDSVIAVTKVITPEKWRGRGCAARLLYRVCQDVLQKKKQVVLYVGNSEGLAPARKVYHKIGFQGLNDPHGQEIEGVEKWLEIGFEGTTLGYW